MEGGSGTSRALLPFHAPSLRRVSFSRARSSSQSQEPTLHTHGLLFIPQSHFLSSSRYKAKGTHAVGTLGSGGPSAAAEKRAVNAFFCAPPTPTADTRPLPSTLSLVLVLIPLTCGLSIARLHHTLRDTHEERWWREDAFLSPAELGVQVWLMVKRGQRR